MRILIAVVFAFACSLAHADNGLVVKKSAFDAATTLDRLEAVLKQKGLTVFARIDHAAGAQKVGAELRPTQVLIFGNPKMGTPLMNSNQTMGIDLPMKALAWEDADGQAWIAYNKPDYLAGRHAVSNQAEIIKKMTGALGKLTDKASQPDS